LQLLLPALVWALLPALAQVLQPGRL